LFELMPANEISLLRLLQEDFEQVLQRPIETAGITGNWKLRNLSFSPASPPASSPLFEP
jgi:hypothetical protein